MSFGKTYTWFRPIHEELLGELMPLIGKSAAHDGQADIHALAEALLTDAVREGVTDVHITPQSEFVQIRFRIDGTLRRSRWRRQAQDGR